MKHHTLAFAAVAAAFALLLATGANLRLPQTASAQEPLYKSCQEDKLTAPLVTVATPSATEVATPAATPSSDSAASTGADNIAFLSIVGSESQACYLASELFLPNNRMNMPAGFNGPVGITQTIAGDIAVDLTNVANSQVGDITINISEFKSDNPRRDSFIRQNFLQSNKYPYATLKNAQVIGLPTGPYNEGDVLTFKIQGTLNVHATDRLTTFDATGSYKNGTLVVRATTDLKISDFGFQPPAIGGLLKVDDPIRLELNLVARVAPAATATPAG